MKKPVYRRHPRNPAAQPFHGPVKHGKKVNSWWNPERKTFKEGKEEKGGKSVSKTTPLPSR